MAKQKICSIHGPYDASYASCPYCSGEINRPGKPQPLMSYDEDDMPTDIGGGGFEDSENPTELGELAGGGRFSDDVDPTMLGEQARDIDVTEIEFVDTSAQGILIVNEGMRRGTSHNVKDGTVVARRDGQIVLNDPKVSNPHAKIRVEDDKFYVWDFGTKNGTYVNGEKIRAATEIKENDTLKIGDTIFVLKVLI